MAGATSGAGTAYSSGAPEFISALLCSVLLIAICAFLHFRLDIALSVLRFTDSDYLPLISLSSSFNVCFHIVNSVNICIVCIAIQ